MDPSTGSASKPLPFSMSGDGVEDVKIPSVFMKKKDVLTLLRVLESVEEEVVVKLSPGPDEPDNEGAKEGEGAEEEGEGGDGVISSSNVENISKQLQSLLEDLDPSILSDELRGSVEEQLQKLKLMNAGLTSSADSASPSEARKEEDAVALTRQIKESVAEQLRVLNSGLGGSSSEELKNTVAEKLQEVMNSGSCSADSAEINVLGEAAKEKAEGEGQSRVSLEALPDLD